MPAADARAGPGMPASAFKLPNVRMFIAFRLLFHARLYYPIFTLLFLDMGMTLEQFALLNAVWAVTIVLLEVPSGALADILGRRNLVVAASALMVVEMAVIAFVPIGNAALVFAALLVNRIVSGAAEAMASGADEALAYDSLVESGMEERWPLVLDWTMRLQSGAFLLAMLMGGFLYDAEAVNAVLGWLGLGLAVAPEAALRFPIYVTLFNAVLALGVSLRTREPAVKSDTPAPGTGGASPTGEIPGPTIAAAFRHTLATGAWILRTRFVLVLIAVALLFDSITRLFVTLASEYYRQIGFPEYAMGILFGLSAGMGLIMPYVGRKLTEHAGAGVNFTLVGALIFGGLLGASLMLEYAGVLFAVVLFAAFSLLSFFLSHYLNRSVESRRRATVLSFRGLACNLAYGFVGMLYFCLTASIKKSAGASAFADSSEALQQKAFTEALWWFPWYFLLTAAGLAVFARWRMKSAA